LYTLTKDAKKKKELRNGVSNNQQSKSIFINPMNIACQDLQHKIRTPNCHRHQKNSTLANSCFLSSKLFNINFETQALAWFNLENQQVVVQQLQ
jgi:hypothetical protein